MALGFSFIHQIRHDGAAIFACAFTQGLVHNDAEDAPDFAGLTFAYWVIDGNDAILLFDNAVMFEIRFKHRVISGGFGGDKLGPLSWNRPFADDPGFSIVESLKLLCGWPRSGAGERYCGTAVRTPCAVRKC